MNYVNTHKPPNRTLAVIDGGLNLKASVEPLVTTQKADICAVFAGKLFRC